MIFGIVCPMLTADWMLLTMPFRRTPEPSVFRCL
jgi:hypothetical protein